MNRALRIALIVTGLLVVAAGLVYAGTWIGQRTAYGAVWPHSAYRMMNAYDRPGRGYGPGMMGGSRGYGPGMMGGNAPATPLTVDQADQAAGKYLATLNNADLKIAEVMVFDNNAYVRVVEQGTGIGAFELLVDPASLAVYPEYGPNMMWNLKYAGLNHQYMMGGRGYPSGMTLAPALRSGASAGAGGMMGNGTFSPTPAQVSADMPVSSEQALQAAQQYLDTALPGTTTAADADPFYGYYTIDILRDGKIVGMLSVNGFSSQVFPHTWHGTFIATRDY
jgi:hypothetical protein